MAATGSTLIPTLRYRDAHAAIDWLCRVFPLTRHAVFEGPNNTIAHAELTCGAGMIMLGSAEAGDPLAAVRTQPDEVGGRSTCTPYLIVPDCEPVYAAAQAAGASMVMPLQTMDYGGKAFTCLDLEGHLWSVGEYTPWASQPA